MIFANRKLAQGAASLLFAATALFGCVTTAPPTQTKVEEPEVRAEPPSDSDVAPRLVVLIILELFVFPGLIIPGVIGALLAGGALVLAGVLVGALLPSKPPKPPEVKPASPGTPTVPSEGVD